MKVEIDMHDEKYPWLILIPESIDEAMQLAHLDWNQGHTVKFDIVKKKVQCYIKTKP